MPEQRLTSVRALFLKLRKRVFVDSTTEGLDDEVMYPVELILGGLGFTCSHRLKRRLAGLPEAERLELQNWIADQLCAELGAAQRHVPLFRAFPQSIPADTMALWWRRFIVHVFQGQTQQCLNCGQFGTTQVVQPCGHVVCSHCFDGANYSACPICQHHIDPDSPFLLATPERPLPEERVTYTLLDLGDDLMAETQALFEQLCARQQPLSKDDQEALTTIVTACSAEVLAWLPEHIPVRENIALIFGSLLQHVPPAEVMAHAERHMSTATDVLRCIAAFSGADVGLQPALWAKTVTRNDDPNGHWRRVLAGMYDVDVLATRDKFTIPIQTPRFKIAPMKRALRRALLAILERCRLDDLVEDMLRHRSLWVWVGQHLHPHEYARRYPKVAQAFHVVRKKAPDGTPAPPVKTWSAQVEAAVEAVDLPQAVRLLSQRPGVFGRRLDHLLRIAQDDAERILVLQAFSALIPDLPAPMLLTLQSHFAHRGCRAEKRVYWPKGKVAKGVFDDDTRPTLPSEITGPLMHALTSELLRRFETLPSFETGILDAALTEVMVPFNARTASPSAVMLPRGSRVPVESGKVMRLFLHWCQPEGDRGSTDLDLSVGLYDTHWRSVGVCSYYQLQALSPGGALMAQSAGDLLSAPWPEGATEFVDIHREAATEAGVRYAVAVINAYSGLPFNALERALAGLMLRDDVEGQHFDPRTVELKFELCGDNGTFMPLVFDLKEGVLHWLDVHSVGQPQHNNVATSNSAITTVCPGLMQYFASGCRPSMYTLGAMHLAARCRRVHVRGEDGTALYVRGEAESVESFHHRLTQGDADASEPWQERAEGSGVLALLYRSDFELPEDSAVYTLFHERVAPTMAASDLLS
ncbi:MAG: MXAN_6230/SCO0854 family RING domain-containing protein [Bradymonadia bacterium]